jgi:pimeloyl-ACP methyl ester carboxylesterase
MTLTWLATRAAGRFSSRLGGSFASRLWFTPWPVPVSDKGARKRAGWLAATDAIELEIDGRRLRGFTAGAGPVILLVHGWGDRAANLGAFISPLVGAGYRVVGIDLPGHGDTSVERADIIEMARVVRLVAERLGGVHAVVAHSMGGTVTSVAIDEGLDVKAVALLAPATDLRHAVTAFGKLFALPHKAVRGLRRDIEHRFGRGIWDRLDIALVARRFSVPALIVHDRDDAQIDVADSLALIEAWPGARSSITSGLGHDAITRDPQVIDSVTTFLSSAARPSGAEPVLVGSFK